MADEMIGCGRVTAIAGDDSPANGRDQLESERAPQEVQMTATVGQKAPDFNAPAYHEGGFTQVSLSEFAGKWVLLCFYPGDFTFV